MTHAFLRPGQQGDMDDVRGAFAADGPDGAVDISQAEGVGAQFLQREASGRELIEGELAGADAKGPDHDFGSSPMLVTLANGGRALIAGQKSGVVHALDPNRQCAKRWEARTGTGGPGRRPVGSRLRRHARLRRVVGRRHSAGDARPPARSRSSWAPFCSTRSRAADCSHSIRRLVNGGGRRRIAAAWTRAAVRRSPRRSRPFRASSFPGGSTATCAYHGGRPRHWDLDTKRDYDTVNGVKAKGGALDGPGAVVVGGQLLVNSGYDGFGGAPGNVLLAFSVDGK